MQVSAKDVNEAFVRFLELFSYPVNYMARKIVCKESRVGNVRMMTEPVLVKYSNPQSRVLVNRERKINPFFFLYEALWMLDGSNDLETLTFFNKQMAEFSDDGKTLNGAYGFRWRCVKDDQIEKIIKELREKPNSRRAVLQMWMVEHDLNKISTSKDVCCNLSVLFAIGEYSGENGELEQRLDMTVFNRSNDLIWGMLGANYVHFTFLQEYIAGNLSIPMGNYYHITNNLHVYENNFKPKEWLDYYKQEKSRRETELINGKRHYYPILSSLGYRSIFDKELKMYMDLVRKYLYNYQANKTENILDYPKEFELPFFNYLALPMLYTYYLHKKKVKGSVLNNSLEMVRPNDWRLAGYYFLEKAIEDPNYVDKIRII